MKSHSLTLLAVLLLVVFLPKVSPMAQVPSPADPVAVPETFPPHPRLFLNADEIDALKAAADGQDWVGEAVDALVSECRRKLEEGIVLPSPSSDEKANLAHAREAAEFALAFALNGDSRFAETTADILRAYVDLYPTYPVTLWKGRATTAALSEATFAVHTAAAYDLIYNDGALDDVDRQAIEQNVLRPCGEVLRTCNHAYRSNWRNRAMAGFGAIGFAIGDRDLIDEALNGIPDSSSVLLRDGFVHQLAEAVLADGVYYERSISYHEAVLENYALLMEAARHSGVDLWHLERSGGPQDVGADRERRFGPAGEKTIKMLYDMPFYYAFSDGSRAAVGNAKPGLVGGRWFYDAAWRQYGDPKFAWITHLGGTRRIRDPLNLMFIAPDIPAGHFSFADDASIGVTGRHRELSTLFPSGGYAILRKSADPDAANVLMTFGKYGSGHSHPDNLAIVISAGGKQVVPEVNHHGYGGVNFPTWNNQTIAHNTVTVDEISQQPQGDIDDPWITDTEDAPVFGEPRFFHADENLKTFRASCATAYDGVRMSRTVALVDGVVVDFFECLSDTPHQYDYALHIDGLLRQSLPSVSGAGEPSLSEAHGYKHIVNARRAILPDGSASISVETDVDRDIQLEIACAEGSELILAEGDADSEGRRLPVVILRTLAADAGFTSVFSSDDRLEGIRHLPELPEGQRGVELRWVDGRRDVLMSAEQTSDLDVGGQKRSGRMVLIRYSSEGEQTAEVIVE